MNAIPSHSAILTVQTNHGAGSGIVQWTGSDRFDLDVGLAGRSKWVHVPVAARRPGLRLLWLRFLFRCWLLFAQGPPEEPDSAFGLGILRVLKYTYLGTYEANNVVVSFCTMP